jgi:hypothetical protein
MTTPSAVSHAATLGAAAPLVKPVDPDELCERAARILGGVEHHMK